MKHWFLMICGILAGCSGIDQSMVPGGSMLDTAPKTNAELRHPEWVYKNPEAHVHQTAPVVAKRPQNLSSLEMFLDRHNIGHEILKGGHFMVRLQEQLHFQTSSVNLSIPSKDWLRTLGHYLAGRPDIDIVINGHADSTGAEQFNDTLSEKRAREVEKQLLAASVPRQRVFTRGFGEYVPQCTNASSSGKACNRRVELMLIVSDE